MTKASSCKRPAKPPSNCAICSKPMPSGPTSRPPERFESSARVVQQHRRVEALEAGENAAIGVLHDALGVLVGTRPEQHTDDDVVLWARRILAQYLVGKTRQSLVHFVRETQPHRVLAVAGAHLGLLGDLENQARDEPCLVDQAQVAEELDF